MQIPEDILKKWTVLRSEGDPKRIADSIPTGCVAQTIRNAFRKGRCSHEIFLAIVTFYNKREEELQTVLNPKLQLEDANSTS